jgi:hypothetical protein
MDNRPLKELVREWMQQRQTRPAPLPDLEQIRRQLGWKLAEKIKARA